MKYRSVFELIGPVMIGPSSSHTAGAVRIGQIARRLFGAEPDALDICFFGSFAQTYKGHATDVALAGGLMGFATDDARLPRALEIAAEQGIRLRFSCSEEPVAHPNTVRIGLRGQGREMQVTGVSIGGGAVRITELDGFALQLSGESATLLILHKDAYGAVAAATRLLAESRINISHMEVSRSEKGKAALMAIEIDQPLDEALLARLRSAQHVMRVNWLEAR